MLFLSLLNRYFIHDALANEMSQVFKQPGSYLFARLSGIETVLSELKRWRRLTAENAELRRNNITLVSRLAEQSSLQKENDFLRRSLKVQQKIAQPVITAGIFMSGLSAPGYQVLINKGTKDGVIVGYIVVTSDGVLVGRVKEALSDISKVQLVTDPGLEVAVQILGKNTLGITQGELNQGISMNLVVQEDQIAEGDTVISNGHDSFPAGLIIGKVTHVEVNESEVFKKIRIEPGMTTVPLGAVLILK